MTNEYPAVSFERPKAPQPKRRGIGHLLPVVFATAICGLMIGTILLIGSRDSESVSAIAAAYEVGDAVTPTGTNETTSVVITDTRVVTEVVYVEVEQIITRIPDPTSTPVPTNTPIPTWTPTLVPSQTPIPATPTSAYLAIKEHNDAMQRRHDRRISFAWDVVTFGGLPLMIVGIVVLSGWMWFKSRDELIDNHQVIEDVDETKRLAIAAARKAESEANEARLASIPVQHGERDKRPRPTIAEALKIQRYLIQDDMSRSAIAVKVYGNSGSTYLPKVDYVIEQMQRSGALPPSPLE